jgi:hypothetical protein
MTNRQSRTERAATPLARDSIRKIAESIGGCLRPVQLRRTDKLTGAVEQVMKPCGATLASICPPCAQRAKTLREMQCREGWHLETEPDLSPPGPDEMQEYWLILRAEAQVQRDHAETRGEDTSDLDALIGELDTEITRSGIRGTVTSSPGTGTGSKARARRVRSTRRRQDAPDLPKRKLAPYTVGKLFTAPGGKSYRPSMFLTLTCDSYGKVKDDGTPVDPATYDYRRAARDALHFPALVDRFIQNLMGTWQATATGSPGADPSGGDRGACCRQINACPEPSMWMPWRREAGSGWCGWCRVIRTVDRGLILRTRSGARRQLPPLGRARHAGPGAGIPALAPAGVVVAFATRRRDPSR